VFNSATTTPYFLSRYDHAEKGLLLLLSYSVTCLQKTRLHKTTLSAGNYTM